MRSINILGENPSVMGTDFRSAKASVSSIPLTIRTNLQRINNSSNILQPIYTTQENSSTNSPNMSPTYSSMTNNPNLNTNDEQSSKIFVLEKEFEIDKEFCRKQFYSKKNKQKREKFFKNYEQEKNEILKEYYNFMNKYKILVEFFEWLVGHEGRFSSSVEACTAPIKSSIILHISTNSACWG
ncbi:Uncharacterized protein TCM_043576 [Theobroma cacao]|uniref:DUF7588 domain-containing protein n=1 Tax=Theobroma cacao TaxID=3641 RepID=A0A061FVZ7_THECC|nr:Uncharacterized protein TCM_043576 [Theobroma cacao]